jgi:hypothetical protein
MHPVSHEQTKTHFDQQSNFQKPGEDSEDGEGKV